MTYVDLDDVYELLPGDWDSVVQKAQAYVTRKENEARALAATSGKQSAEIEAAVVAARKVAIENKSEVWHYASAALAEVSHEKCWYCETKQIRSDKAVDHFRPKGGIYECPGHPGYYWLAFVWENFRYSCTFCNSLRCDRRGGSKGGKQHHFPIIQPPGYALSASDPEERPALLDPTDDSDTKLLTFLKNGFPAPSTADPAQVRRVEKSIELYHWKQSALVRKRKMLHTEIQNHVRLGETARVSNDNASYRYHKKEIIKRVRMKAQFSSAARIYLHPYADKAWVAEILRHHL